MPDSAMSTDKVVSGARVAQTAREPLRAAAQQIGVIVPPFR